MATAEEVGNEQAFPYVRRWINDIRVTCAHPEVPEMVEKIFSELNHSCQCIVEFIAKTYFEHNKPVSYRNLRCFEVNGEERCFAPGTLRNLLSKIEKSTLLGYPRYIDGRKYFHLKYTQIPVGNSVTGHPRGGKATRLANNQLYKMLKDVPMEDPAIHDIHLTFNVLNIWSTLAKSDRFPVDPTNKSIVIKKFCEEEPDISITLTINHTDTVVVMIGCTSYPFRTFMDDSIRLATILGKVEQKLKTMIEAVQTSVDTMPIPHCLEWRTTMLHLGRDAKIQFTGEKFDLTLPDVAFGLLHVYTKNIAGKTKLRLESTEKPIKPVLALLASNCLTEA